jgi:hypothetical protein
MAALGPTDQVRRRLALALAGLLAAGCEDPNPARTAAGRQRLVGTWLREFEHDSVRVRRVVELGADGNFREMARIALADGKVEQESFNGVWLFDGINFKRKYTHRDGAPLSGSRITYATYRLEAGSDDELVGIDDVQNRVIRYQRAPAGTQP